MSYVIEVYSSGRETNGESAGTPLIFVPGASPIVGSEPVRQHIEVRQRVRALASGDALKARRLGAIVEIVKAGLAEPETLLPGLAVMEDVFLLSEWPGIATLEVNAMKASRRAGVGIVELDARRRIDAHFFGRRSRRRVGIDHEGTVPTS